MSDYTTTTDSGATCFRCCFSFILTLGLTSLFMWLSLRTSNPILSIQDIYVPALNKTLNSTSYKSVYIDLKLDNVNKDKGIYYDPLNITLLYYNQSDSSEINKIVSPISNYTLRGFYQGHNKHTRRKNWTETYGLPVDGGVVFKLDLETKIRFKILFWKTKRHRLVVGADFEVSDLGQKVQKKGTRLKSGAPELFYGKFQLRMLLVSFSSFALVFV
ncbi:protein NDR1-like [Rutidosis leptorrhynchoides]|uniref:protein NDR1-like n=1 Tax=Rutidosis leptorrhynchoides TaxID=125765 RepID=UPI003A9A1796